MTYIPGDYWMECFSCGFKFRRSRMRRRWDGPWVCEKDWEPRHPQDLVRGKADSQSVWPCQPESEPVFIESTAANTLVFGEELVFLENDVIQFGTSSTPLRPEDL